MKMKTKFSENEAGITLLFNRASEAQTHNNVYAVFKKQSPLLLGRCRLLLGQPRSDFNNFGRYISEGC